MPLILIVDDDAVHRDLAGRYLEGIAGLETVFAANGNEAMGAIAGTMPDLVLTDL